MLAQFHEQHLQVRCEIFSGSSDDIKERTERGLLDAGFLLEPVDVSKYEFARLPIREEWGILLSCYFLYCNLLQSMVYTLCETLP